MQQSTDQLPRVAFIFDFDGTLVDTYPMFESIALQIADEFKLDTTVAKNIAELRDLDTKSLLKKLGLSVYQMAKFAIRSQEIMNERIDEVQLIPRIDHIIAGLKERNITLGVLSSNSEANVRKVLRHADLEKYFDFIDTGSSLFGKAKKIRSAVKNHNLQLEYTYYFGDETRDIEGANKAKVHSIGVSWGFNSEKALQSMGPEKVLTSVEQILELV